MKEQKDRPWIDVTIFEDASHGRVKIRRIDMPRKIEVRTARFVFSYDAMTGEISFLMDRAKIEINEKVS